MRRVVAEQADLFAAHYVDLAAPAAEAGVVQRLRDSGLATFDGLTGRGNVTAFARRIMAITPHRDSDPDGLTTIRDIGRAARHSGFAGLGSGELLAHTERSGVPAPPRLMLLVCEQPAVQGGECLLVDGRVVHADVSACSPEAARMLSLPRTAFFGAGNGHATQVFTFHPSGRVSMRLRQDDLARWSPLVDPYVPQLCAAIGRHQRRIALTTGQGYLLDNQRWLHARTQFSGDRRCLRVLGEPHLILPQGFVINPLTTALPMTSEVA